MTTNNNLIEFRRSSAVTSESQSLMPSWGDTATLETSIVSEGNALRRLRIRDLYPDIDDENAYIGPVLRLLDEVIACLEEATNADLEYIEKDTALLKARVILLKAFDYRDSLGDGYAALLNACIWALYNASVEPLTRKQIRAISEIVTRLHDGPYLHFDSAMPLMDSLEEHGLDIEPHSLDDLLVNHES